MLIDNISGLSRVLLPNDLCNTIFSIVALKNMKANWTVCKLICRAEFIIEIEDFGEALNIAKFSVFNLLFCDYR